MSREKEIYKVTLIGSAGNAALLTFKFIAGVMGNSSAMIADAVHSLSDFVTDLLVLVFVSISGDMQEVMRKEVAILHVKDTVKRLLKHFKVAI